MTKHKSKIFGIGFHKTATTSLGAALEILGYRCCGSVGTRNPRIQEDVYKLAFSLAERYDAFQDNPWPLLYRDLDARFPNSKFILTIRSTEGWLNSIVSHFGDRSSPMREWIYGVGAPLGNEALYRRRYEAHNAEVMQYFQYRPADLLIMDITQGEGWEKLCPFLGTEVPTIAFPNLNRAENRIGKSHFKLCNLMKKIAAASTKASHFIAFNQYKYFRTQERINGQ